MTRPTLSPIPRSGGTESGQSLVEFALTAGFLLLVMFAIVDLGRATYINTMLASAAQEGTRAGSFTDNTGTIVNTVKSHLTLINPDEVDVSVTRTKAFTTITANYTYHPLVPIVTVFTGPDGLQLTQTVRNRNLGVIIQD
jgi:Flp pilus assembly protein TadG